MAAGGALVQQAAVAWDTDGDLLVPRRRPHLAFTLHHHLKTRLSDVGLQVWRGSLLLADYVISHTHMLHGCIALELGAGAGLAGLALAAAGARRVFLTDLGTAVLDNCQWNVDANQHLFPAETADLGELSEVSIVLAADVVYDDALTDAFLDCAAQLLRPKPGRAAPVLLLAIERRVCFTLEDLAPAAPAYNHLLARLREGVRNKLVVAGFRTAADLEDVRPADLAREAELSHEDALLALKTAGVGVQDSGLAGSRTAAELLAREAATRRIITFCGDLDEVLGGGVATGQLTEFCGVPAVGKTQLGIQLALDVQLPAEVGGLAGQAIYIDTEGSFMVERVAEMADAVVRHLQRLAARNEALGRPSVVPTRDQLLSGITYFRARDYSEQAAVVQQLPELLEQNPEVRLVVLDSVAFHFRSGFEDMAARTRVLAQLAQALMRLAETRDAAVVLMNQVTTKVMGNDQAKMVPALGDSWAHAATSRVILHWQGAARCAYLYKSPCLPARSAEYLVCADGVRGRRPSKRPRPDPPA
ncbi:hypothetical protein WJX81_003761 [Elliptochloris bilobata]|uniref:DNA repair protein RAD51 homolog 3 n=1 Tax=Elliptochloris bilobata TaxID=381761 RepID=A0AAW1SCR2_9CHLO